MHPFLYLSMDSEPAKSIIPSNFIPGNSYEGSLSKFILENIPDEIVQGMKRKQSLRIVGASMVDNVNYEGNLSVVGSYLAHEGVICENLSITGSAKFSGFLAVRNRARVTGSIMVDKNIVFVNNSTITGSILVSENLISSGKLTLVGRTSVNKKLISDGEVRAVAKLRASELVVLGTFSSQRELLVDRMVRARNLFVGRGGEVGGILAENVVVANNPDKELINKYPQLPSGVWQTSDSKLTLEYLKAVFRRLLRRKRLHMLSVRGDVVGDNIYLENTEVFGEVKGRVVTIGDNVVIHGKLQYTESVELPEGSDIDIQKVDEIKGLPSNSK